MRLFGKKKNESSATQQQPTPRLSSSSASRSSRARQAASSSTTPAAAGAHRSPYASSTATQGTTTAAPTTPYTLQRSDRVSLIRTYSRDDNDNEDSMYLRQQMYLSESVRMRVDEAQNNPELSEHDKVIIQRLAMRSFHLPGNSFWEDWHAFLWNNHPIFGLTGLADPRHPFGLKERIINLVASLAFGLMCTSCVVLWYYYHDRDMNQTLFTLGNPNGHHLDVSQGLFWLLFFGGFIHVIFDFGLWFLQACPCCREGGFCMPYMSPRVVDVWLWLGHHLALEVTIVSLLLCIYVIVLRATLPSEDDSTVDDTDQLNRIRNTGIEDYMFVASYALEVVVSLFVLFPIVAFTIFSGVLGCGVLPGIGGRPWQKRRWKQRQERMARKNNQDGLIELESRPSGAASV